VSFYKFVPALKMNTISDFRNNEYDFVIDPGRIMKTPRPEVKPHDSSL